MINSAEEMQEEKKYMEKIKDNEHRMRWTLDQI